MSSAEGRLAGRVALITGAGSGIGRAALTRFAAEGAAVLAVDRDPVGDLPPGAASLTLDVTAPGAAEQAVAAAVERFGGLDVAYGNAGRVALAAPEQVDDGHWRAMLDLNLSAQFALARAAVAPLRARGGGSIVLTASEMAFSAARASSAYIAAKAGVVGLVRALAADLGPDGIRVNALAPGPTDTPMLRGWLAEAPDPEALLAEQLRPIALGRLGGAAEVAAAALFLAGDDSSFVTGHTLIVDGGVTAWSGS